jgi:hypothetical protein
MDGPSQPPGCVHTPYSLHWGPLARNHGWVWAFLMPLLVLFLIHPNWGFFWGRFYFSPAVHCLSVCLFACCFAAAPALDVAFVYFSCSCLASRFPLPAPRFPPPARSRLGALRCTPLAMPYSHCLALICSSGFPAPPAPAPAPAAQVGTILFSPPSTIHVFTLSITSYFVTARRCHPMPDARRPTPGPAVGALTGQAHLHFSILPSPSSAHPP